jgi:hypothetical protein
VGDLAEHCPGGTVSSRSGPRKRQETDEQAKQSDVHDPLGINALVEDIEPSYTGKTAMAIVSLPLPSTIEARPLLHHLLEQVDIVGRDAVGRTIIQLAVDDWVLERLMTFDADAAEVEDEGDDEPEADDEEDGPPVVIELVRPKMVRGRRALESGCVG